MTSSQSESSRDSTIGRGSILEILTHDRSLKPGASSAGCHLFGYSYLPFTLENFEGPLELLYYLIQKEEIYPCGIVIKKLTSQLIQALKNSPEIDTSSEFLHLTACLLLIKSQKLLPYETESLEEQEDDPRIEMIQSLIEYCRFKEMAQALAIKEEQQKAFFPRPLSPFKKEHGPGLDEVDKEGLKNLLQQILKKAAKLPEKMIQEEQWQVADKVVWLRHLFQSHLQLTFETIFSPSMGREELIVSFLALLELMKYQHLKIVRENETLYIRSLA